jgi:hypothetical protein
MEELTQSELTDEIETGEGDAAETVADLAFPPGPS